MITSIEVRTIGGEVWMNARHVTTRLREIAEEHRQAALGYGDPVPDEHYDTVRAFHAVAIRLDETADRIDLSVIEHITDHPGDSNPGGSDGQDLEA